MGNGLLRRKWPLICLNIQPNPKTNRSTQVKVERFIMILTG
jgi:hypothetical protein